MFIATLSQIDVISYSFTYVYCYTISNWCYLLITFYQFIATISWIHVISYSLFISLLLQYLELMLSLIHFSSVYCYNILNWCYLLFTFHQFIATLSRIDATYYSLLISLLLHYFESMLSRIQFSSVYCYTILNQCYLVFNFHQFIATISRIDVISYSLYISLLLQYLESMSSRIHFFISLLLQCLESMLSRIQFSSVKSMLYLTHFTSVYCYNISNQCYLLFINVVICLLLHYLELILSLIHFSSVYCYNISNIHAISYSLSSVYGTISWINVISYSLSSIYCYTISNWYYLLFTFHQFIATLSRIKENRQKCVLQWNAIDTNQNSSKLRRVINIYCWLTNAIQFREVQVFRKFHCMLRFSYYPCY